MNSDITRIQDSSIKFGDKTRKYIIKYLDTIRDFIGSSDIKETEQETTKKIVKRINIFLEYIDTAYHPEYWTKKLIADLNNAENINNCITSLIKSDIKNLGRMYIYLDKLEYWWLCGNIRNKYNEECNKLKDEYYYCFIRD